MLIKGTEKVGIENFKNLKAFIDYSQTIDGVHQNLEDYNQTKNRRVLIVFDDMTENVKPNKKLSPIVTELFLKERKLSIFLVFISQSFLKGSKTIRINALHYFIMKNPNKRELQRIVSNHSSDIDFKDFTKLYQEYTK